MPLDWSEAFSSTKSGKLWGYIDMGKTFTDDTKAKFTEFQANNGSNINLYLDSSSKKRILWLKLNNNAYLIMKLNQILKDHINYKKDPKNDKKKLSFLGF